MDRLTVFDEIKTCIGRGNSFVVHGGAGSGKTQILKKTIEYLKSKSLDDKLLCITHTNVAVEEIQARIETGGYTVSTIHSFLNQIISNHKRNIRAVLSQYFALEFIPQINLDEFNNEKEFKSERHKKYKKCRDALAKVKFELHSEGYPAAEGKRIFDSDPDTYIYNLNKEIEATNLEIDKHIASLDYRNVGYNESRFDSIQHGTYGHDGLIKVSVLLFEKYDKLQKIFYDKFQYVLIDEYQDSNKEIVNLIIDLNYPIVLGLFGDSMQGIYKDTIGSAAHLCDSGKLHEIMKPDNYRCCEQVTSFVNELRLDNLVQHVELKDYETRLDQRQGTVKLFYSILDEPKPSSKGRVELKDNYLNILETLTEVIVSRHPTYKVLILTNKSVASKVGFKNLFSIFSNRYIEVGENLDKFFEKSNYRKLCQLISDYKNKKYNNVISYLRKSGFSILKVKDKERIKLVFEKFDDDNLSMWDAMIYAKEEKLLSNFSYLDYFKSKNEDLISELALDSVYNEFKENYEEGHNTYIRISKCMNIEDELEFKALLSKFRKESFYKSLTKEELKFTDALSYNSYVNEETTYITMHKTKGTSLENIIVVNDNYFWGEYSFDSVYEKVSSNPTSKELLSRKLFYVACSRCVSNLIIAQVFEEEISKSIAEKFCEIVKI